MKVAKALVCPHPRCKEGCGSAEELTFYLRDEHIWIPRRTIKSARSEEDENGWGKGGARAVKKRASAEECKGGEAEVDYLSVDESADMWASDLKGDLLLNLTPSLTPDLSVPSSPTSTQSSTLPPKLSSPSCTLDSYALPFSEPQPYASAGAFLSVEFMGLDGYAYGAAALARPELPPEVG